MKRTVSEIRVGAEQIRYRTRIEDDPSTIDSDQARMQQFAFLQQLANSPHLLACGLQYFQQMKFYHCGTCWVAECEATVTEPVS